MAASRWPMSGSVWFGPVDTWSTLVDHGFAELFDVFCASFLLRLVQSSPHTPTLASGKTAVGASRSSSLSTGCHWAPGNYQSSGGAPSCIAFITTQGRDVGYVKNRLLGMCMCICVWMYYVSMYVYIIIYIYMYMCTCIYIYIFIYLCMCVCICIYVCVYSIIIHV